MVSSAAQAQQEAPRRIVVTVEAHVLKSAFMPLAFADKARVCFVADRLSGVIDGGFITDYGSELQIAVRC
jgi:hypothetical protein